MPNQGNQSIVVDASQENEDTYNSSAIRKAVWYANEMGENGFLQVEFENGGNYLYVNVPRQIAEGLYSRAHDPETFDSTVGEFFHNRVLDEFNRYGEDYAIV